MDDKGQPSAPTNPQLDPEIERRNLLALRAFDPPLADRIAEATIPPTARLAVGRDGAVTFRLESGPDGAGWFGRTSMPTVSGPALLEDFDTGNGNVLLPGIGQGTEMRLLVNRLAGHRAVFVLEEDLVCIRLALRLHEVSDAIRAGRLVILSGRDPESVLPAFFRQHPGYVPPDRVLSWPWLPPTGQQQLRLAMERSTVMINGEVDRLSGALSEKLGKLTCEDIPDRPRCVVLGFDPTEATARRVTDLASAMAAADWAVASCLPDRPSHVTSLAHGRTVLDHAPDFLVLVNHLRDRYRGLLPAGLPAASVFTASAAVSPSATRKLGPSDHVFVESPESFKRLTDEKENAGLVYWMPPAANAQLFRPLEEEEIGTFDVGDPVDVAIIADGADLSAQACGFALPSHQALWDGILEQAASDPDGLWPETARGYVVRGEKSTGIRLKGDDIRETFTQTLVRVGGATLVTRILAQGLMHVGLRVGLWGWRWESHEPLQGCLRGGVRSAVHRNAIYQRCTMAVSADFHGHEAANHLDAMAAGALALVRRRSGAGAGARRTDSGPAPLTFASIKECLRIAQSLVQNKGQAEERLAALRARIASEATWGHRIERLAQALRAGSGRRAEPGS